MTTPAGATAAYFQTNELAEQHILLYVLGI